VQPSENDLAPDEAGTEAFFRRLAENSPIGIFLVQEGQFRFVNREFERCTGFKMRELVGRDCLSLVHPSDRAMVRAAAVEMLKAKRATPYEYRVITADRRVIWILETVTSISYQGNRAAAGNFMNITERKSLEEKLREQARRDSLTGLLNHGAIIDELQSLIAESADGTHAVAVGDVCSLKRLNDQYGHQAGDAVLNAVAEALSVGGAIVGRYGGDEFVVILPDFEWEQATAYRESVAQTLSKAKVTDPRTGATFLVALTLGMAIYPADGGSADELIAAADARMYDQRRKAVA